MPSKVANKKSWEFPVIRRSILALIPLFLLGALTSCTGGSLSDGPGNPPVAPPGANLNGAAPNLEGGWPSPDGHPQGGDAWILDVQAFSASLPDAGAAANKAQPQTLQLSARVRCVWNSGSSAPLNPCQDEGRIIRLVNWKSHTYVETPLHNTGQDSGSFQVEFSASPDAIDFFTQQTQPPAGNIRPPSFVNLRRDTLYPPEPLAQEHDCKDFKDCASPQIWIPQWYNWEEAPPPLGIPVHIAK
jgi:hypothetical protein